MDYEIKNLLASLESMLENVKYSNFTDNIKIAIDILSNIKIEEKLPVPETKDNYFEYRSFADGLAIVDYYGFDDHVKIPDEYNGKKITRIAAKAFRNCLKIKKLILGKNIDVIEYEAFYGCINLETVEIQGSLLFIGNNAFNECKQLAHINLPDTVRFIGEGAFSETSLEIIKIPTSLLFLSKSIFSGCEKLKHVFIHNNVVAIGKHAFDSCASIKEIVLPPSVEVVYDMAFCNCISLEKVKICNQKIKIAWDAFEYIKPQQEDDWADDIIFTRHPLPNLTVFCLEKSTAQKFCRERLIKTEKVENSDFSELLQSSKLTDVIGFTFPKNKKNIELRDLMHTNNFAIFEKYGGEFIFTSIIYKSVAKPFTIKDYMESKHSYYVREL